MPISDLTTVQLISIADLYVTSYSSTIRWAIAASVPVINIDMYGFNYEDFENCAGVLSIKTVTDFDTVMLKLKEEKAIYDLLKKAQEIDSKSWGMMNGKSTERIINLIYNLCQ